MNDTHQTRATSQETTSAQAPTQAATPPLNKAAHTGPRDDNTNPRTKDQTEPTPHDQHTGTPEPPARRRKKLLAGAAALVTAAVTATVTVLALPDDDPAPSPHTVAVTYKVTGAGKATITYNTGHPDAPGGRAQLVDLPWTKKVRVNPASGPARVSVVLDKNGGTAQCAVAVAGHHRQRTTALGNFGRATCSAKVPDKATTTR